MSRPAIWTIQLFRATPGDLPIKDAFLFEDEGLAEAEQATAERLEEFFRNAKRAQGKPTQAYLLGEDDSILAQFRMTSKGAEKVNREKANA